MNPILLRYLSAFCFVLFHSYSLANCTPPLTGSPCSNGGIASIANIEPNISLSAGNPVNIVTGNKYQIEVDSPPNPSTPGLELIRHYNSYSKHQSAFGIGWSSSYETRLFRIGNTWQIVQADGSRIIFTQTSAAANGTMHNQFGQLIPLLNNEYQWLWPTGAGLLFNEQGLVTSINTVSSLGIYIQRYPAEHQLNGAIKTIYNDNAQSISFEYKQVDNHALIKAVNTHSGRFSYFYDAQHRLIKMVRPDGSWRDYLYDSQKQSGNSHALTSINTVIKNPYKSEQLASWHYDLTGRVVRTVIGNEQSPSHVLNFNYSKIPTAQADGLTIISNAQGEKTFFHSQLKNQRYVINKVKGAVCHGCPAPGTNAEYDQNGRISKINNTNISRFDNGMLKQLNIKNSGWTNLSMHYNESGFRDKWGSSETGTEHSSYNKHKMLTKRSYANGDSMHIQYDILKRPISIVEKHKNKQSTTLLNWDGDNLIKIEHPNETELRYYDDYSKVIQRKIIRPSNYNSEVTTHKESFTYDNQNRLLNYKLAEGGHLSYDWGIGQQIKAIYWHDINGIRHPIIQTIPDLSGYRYGNGIHLDTASDSQNNVRYLRVYTRQQKLFTQSLSYDTNQRIKAETLNSAHNWNYAYDDNNQLIASQYHLEGTASNNKITTWHAWAQNGQADAMLSLGVTKAPSIKRDTTGLPTHADGLDLSYSSNRRLDTVYRSGKKIVEYGHNAFGYQVTRTTQQSHTNYYYLDNKLVAQNHYSLDRTKGASKKENLLITRRYIYAHNAPVAIIDYSYKHPSGKVFYIHADLQGAPRLLTDSKQAIRWQASYTSLGLAENIQGDMQLNLRLPGQIYDEETGLHDNLLRTFAPQWGHYLEPDPLGPVPINQAYGYAAQQPRRYIDPTGLLLFAFDGTRQSERTKSNVWKLAQYYMDGRAHYHSGPGNSSYIDWDALTANQTKQILDTQWKWLVLELSRASPNETTPIDIIGFSRGAALARHFGNLISEQVNQGLFEYNDPTLGAISACVDLRFMGLFDSVAQFGIAGSQNHLYDLSVNTAWEWVAHAIALHEHRKLFPLLIAGDSGGYNVIETPFVGAHSDIGGGVLPDDQGTPNGRGDLSDVALNWMLWQARAATVNFNQPNPADLTVTSPILHDFRPALLRRLYESDRSVQSSKGQKLLNKQGAHDTLGQAARKETEVFITRHPNWRTNKTAEVGEVDLNGYAHWLHDRQGWNAPPV